MGRNHVTTDEHHSMAASLEHNAVSFRALVWVAELRSVTWAERGVLTKLANHANKAGGSAWPSVRTIADWAGVDERSVRRILSRLLKRGLIEVTGANSRDGGRYSTTYRVVIPAGYEPNRQGADQPEGEDTSVPPRHDRGDASVRGAGTPVSPEPVLNLSSSKKNHSVLTDGAQGRAGEEETRPETPGQNPPRFEELVRDGAPILQRLDGYDANASCVALLRTLVQKCGGDCRQVMILLLTAERSRPPKPLQWVHDAAGASVPPPASAGPSQAGQPGTMGRAGRDAGAAQPDALKQPTVRLVHPGTTVRQ